jgi:hypothetical protein
MNNFSLYKWEWSLKNEFFYVESISNHTSIYRVLKIMNFGIKKKILKNRLK